MTDLVIMHDQQAVTTSLKVAEIFHKRHADVIRAIEDKIHSTQNCVQYKSMFAEGEYTDASGKTNKLYYLDRDGFSFIAFGFTGKQADEFKLAYIQAFNQMEQQVRLGVPQTLPEALRLAADLADERDKERNGRLIAEQQVGELQPKASYYDKVLANPSLVTISVIAKDYGMSARAMNKLLHDLKVQYKQGSTWLLYSKYQTTGWTHSDTTMVKRHDGTEKAVLNTKWTQKGRLGLYELLKDHGVLPLIEQEA